jgi:hypothetical protein
MVVVVLLALLAVYYISPFELSVNEEEDNE